MPFETLNLGIQLTLPTNGTKNWGTTLKNTTWTKISQHQHTGSGDGAKLLTTSLNDAIITTAKLANNMGRKVATTLTPAGTTETVNWDNGNVQKLDLGSASGNVTLTFSNPATGAWYQLTVQQAATARTITWPGTVLWANGQAPILSTADDSIDMVWFYWDGTNYFGTWENAFA